VITVNLPADRRRRRLRWLRPTVVAVFSFRYDAHLVPDLLANLEPIVDGWIAWDDRAATEAYSSEPARRRWLLEAAHQAGAHWILAVDPDERFERGTSHRIRWLVRAPGRVCWTFDLREMYTPSAYRTDGIWGRKRQKRLFPIFKNQFPIVPGGAFNNNPLHASWVASAYKVRHSGLNVYHLKMIAPARRAARRDLYNALDPAGKFQREGYDYLADEGQAVLEEIPPGREYLPAHTDDGGLWMPDPARVPSVE